MSFKSECQNANSVKDYQDPEFDGRTFGILKGIFASVIEDIVIKEVLVTCKGNLTSSIECLMRITNTNKLSLNKDTVSLPIDECGGNDSKALDPAPAPILKEVASATNIMLSYSQTAGQKADKQLPTTNNNYSPKNNNLSVKVGSLITNNVQALKAIEEINKGYLVMVLMRGLPGSGKSTAAKQIIDATVKGNYNNHIFSTDDFFMTRNGYRFIKDKLNDAHLWNQKRVKKELLKGTSPIIVDNTNTQIWEMQMYVINASENGYILHVVEPLSSWAVNPSKLASKNIHGVPLDNITKMLYRYEQGLTPTSLLNFFKCQQPPDPPISRTFPKLVTPQVNPVTSQMNSQYPDSQEVLSKSRGFTIQRDIDIPQNINKSINYNGQDVSSKSQSSTVQRDLDIPQNTVIRGWNDFEVLMLDRAGAVNIIGFSQTDNVIADIKDSPKPQRSLADKRKPGRNKLFTTSESVNWEPFCPTTSEWAGLNISAVQPTNGIISPLPSTVEYMDSSTNTQSFDTKPENWSFFTLLTPVSRNINSSYFSSNIISPRLKLSLDKGTMTSDEEEFNIMAEDSKNKAEHLKNMKAVFSHIPEHYLKDILERCNGDFNWAVEILLDGETENGFINSEEKQVPGEPSEETESIVNSLCSPMQNTISETLKDEENREKTAYENACMQEKCLEESVNLKKHLEHNFSFSDDHYSNHVLKLRRKIHGIPAPKEDENMDNLTMFPEPMAEPYVSPRTSSESSEEVSEEGDNVVSVTVGNEFIQSLHEIYGVSSCDHPLEPVIHMPLSLLNQIHALWMESLYNQIDVQKEYLKSIIKEDEDFARKLEAKEKEEELKGQPQPVPNLREIMDMEVALAQYKVDISDWKKETPDDMASRLSRQKLLQLFPDIDPDVVLEVLSAHNNNFDQTCQSLLVSTGRIPITQAADEGLKSIQPLLLAQERDLLARANREQQTARISPEASSASTSSELDGKTIIKQYRDQAVQHLEIRKVHLNKAMEYYNRGMTQTAAYYSQMAHLHTKKHDYINNLAASEIMEANTSTKNDYTLDLHSLYVVEARQVLDMFLDKHIQQLRERGTRREQKLFLITGRGLHSPKMHARIKPAVIIRLKARKIRYSEVNPGLLCITVSGLHLLTDAIADTNNQQ